MIEWFASVLERLGRRRVIVMRKGDIFVERYYPFLMNEPGATGWKTRLPNVVIHHFPSDVRDEFEHDHGRGCASFMARGGYTELRGGKEVKRKAPCMWRLRYDEFHQIVKVEPDTWTVFFVGPKRREYRLKMPRTGRIVERSELHTPERLKTVIGVQKETPELHERIALRRKAMSK